MTRRFRLAAVLRARQAQEGAAKAAVMNARADAARAADRAHAADRAIDGTVPVSSAASFSAARSLVSALMIRRARAESAAQAYRDADDADHLVGERIGQWSDAAVQHRIVDKLAERHRDEVRRADDASDQLLIDELATTASVRETVSSTGGAGARPAHRETGDDA